MKLTLIAILLVNSLYCLGQQDTTSSISTSSRDLFWKSANGRKKPTAFITRKLNRYSFGVLETSENSIQTNLFFISSGWGTTGQIAWYTFEGNSMSQINSFFKNPKGEKACYNELRYLTLSKKSLDHDTYYVKNRGRRVGLLEVYDGKLKYRINATRGYPDTNLFIESIGELVRLR
jgi:hypothetical protein